MPLVQTRGAASAQGFGEFAQASAVPNYIEEVFSTFLYDGTGASQTITNGIDLSTKGGLVWVKARAGSSGASDHILVDTVRGISSGIKTSTTDAASGSAGFTAFNSTGFTFGSGFGVRNDSSTTYASWTFREQPKFFDVVTYTGTGVANRQIAHSLGSTPGCIIVKSSSIASNWRVWQRAANVGSGDGNAYGTLNATNAFSLDGGVIWGDDATVGHVEPTSTNFTVSANSSVNSSGNTYVAYIFAHNAGGFGLTGTDNVISCGTFTCDGSGNATVNLGFEPQWILAKVTNTAGYGWQLTDNMRGLPVTPSQAPGLLANTSAAEVVNVLYDLVPTSTGFNCVAFSASMEVIYIAIRRGPMKVPTDATKVFAQTSTTSATTPLSVTTNFPVDMAINRYSGTTSPTYVFSRLTGAASDGTNTSVYLQTNSTAAETAPNAFGDSMVSNTALIDYAFLAGNSNAKIYWNFRRAPQFFDEVCYTGTGSAQALTHNLNAVPEMMIVKRRNSATAGSWFVYTSFIGNDGYLALNDTTAVDYWINIWNDTTPTSTQFTVGSYLSQSGGTHVAYLFATCAGVSKVGSYTGNGTTQTINCGFTGGARFVLIKRTDAVNGWYVYDTARGMTVLTDPYLFLNTSGAESATLGSVTTVSTGFALDSTILAAINVSAGSYIFLAIA